MALTNEKTYRFASRADTGRSLNVYASAGTAPSLSNVCLWTSSPSDTGQQWVYKNVDGNEYLVCKENENVALDMYTGSTSGQTNVNAHVYAPSSTSYIKFEETDSGYVKIRLANYSNKYLTANQGSNGSGSGRTVDSAGNIYWYAGGLTDHSQEWWPVPVNEGSGDISGNYLTYPTKVMNITQSYNGTYNHYLYSSGSPVDYPIDDACEDSGRSWFYCPCDEMKVVRVYGVGTTGTNTIWLESTSPVITPSGTFVVTMMIIHPEDDDIANLLNHTFKRGDAMFREGRDGNATGYHVHISVGKGTRSGNGWSENSNSAWVLTTNGTLKPESAFYIDTSFTTIKNTQGLNFRNLPFNS